MKKFINKALLLLLVLFVGISLTACDEEAVDTTSKHVPYGTLSSDKLYASVGNIKLSEKALYDELRVNGYDYLFEEIIKLLIKPADYSLSVANNREELIELVNQNCFGTSEQEVIDEMNSTTINKHKEKFVDTMALNNITITVDDIYTNECLEFFINQLAQKYYAKAVLNDANSIYYWGNEYQKENGEFVLDDNGKKIKNIYYIDEETIESSYNSNKDKDAQYSVVIVGYNTLAEANAALNGLDKDALTFDNFKTMYYNQYPYKTVSDDNFLFTSEDLAGYNSSLVSLINNMEEGTYQVNKQFGKMVYSVYLNAEKPEADYAKLEGAEKETAKTETIKEIIDQKVTSTLISKMVMDKVFDTEIVIYDYVFDALYAAENSDHKRLEESAWKDEYNNYVAKVGEQYITVASFYESLEKTLGLTTTMDYFTSKVLLNSEYANKLTDKDLETINTQYNDVIKAFEENGFASNGLPTSVGKDVFLFSYFGHTSEEEIKEYYKSQKIWDYYVEAKPENYYQLAYEFGKQYHDKYFNLSVKHILLTVDFDSDGNPDDPEIFAKKLSAEKQTAFTNAIVAAMDAIVKEVNFIVSEDHASLVDALDYVLKQFYAEEQLLSDTTKTWADYKSEFNLGLTIEDLSSVNSSTASKYVKEFGIGVQKLYAELAEKNILNKDYLAEKVENINELIKTNYGYHILGVYDSGDVSSAEYTADNDNSKQYVEIKVELDGEKTTIADAYSENKWASINQIKIFEAQDGTEDGVTDLPTAVKTTIGNFYKEFETRFNNDSFRNILLAETELNIVFENDTDNSKAAKFDKFVEIQKHQFDQYENYDSTSISFLANWWELVDQYIINYTPSAE